MRSLPQNGTAPSPIHKAVDLPEEDRDFLPIWEACRPFTMTSFARGLALFRSIRYIVSRPVPGTIVECGVWRGGSVMIVLLALSKLNAANRRVFLFDTFDGMTAPSAIDIDHKGQSASALLDAEKGGRDDSAMWARASLDDVKANISSTGYDMSLIEFVAGDVKDTLPATRTGVIALLRLDTDFYDSTLVELETLYPRLIQHGVLLIDDYGHWQGCRQAVDEYFSIASETNRNPRLPMFHVVDFTGRIAIRSEPTNRAPTGRYDFEPPGLETVSLDRFFPSQVPADPATSKWPYLRQAAPHIWRIDTRSKEAVGVLSREEALILYNLARPFKGKRGLEIGSYFGWSSAHLVSAGLKLDVIDPRFGDPDHLAAVSGALRRIDSAENFRLIAGFSPSVVPVAAASGRGPYSFAFIDGNHDGEAPLRDAETVINFCDRDACVVFHDLTAPSVAAGLQYFQENGWKTRVYNTMQIIGVAWRGRCKPINHTPDERMPEIDSEHLRSLGND